MKGQAVRVVQFVLLVRVVKQWLTSRTSGELHMISETWGVVRVVKQWLTSRTSGELHMISETWSVGTSGTSRTTRTTRTGRETMAYKRTKK